MDVDAQPYTPVEDLEREIDAILERRPSADRRRVRRRLALTEANVRRLFGMTRWALFRELAAQFGYVIEDDTPPKVE